MVSRSTSTTSTTMPTGSESNGSGPGRNGSGPFNLGEMERLANEMFRTLPGGILPGIDPEQLISVPLPADAEPMLPAAGMMPATNGHAPNGIAAMTNGHAANGIATGLDQAPLTLG